MCWSHSNRFLLSAGDGRVEHFWKSSSCFKESDLHWEWEVREGEKSAEIKGAMAGLACAVTPPWPTLQRLPFVRAAFSGACSQHPSTKRENAHPTWRNSTLGHRGLGWAPPLLSQGFHRRHWCHSSSGSLGCCFWGCPSLAHFPDFVFQEHSAENLRLKVSIKSSSLQFSL